MNIIDSIIKCTFWTGATIVVGGAAILFLTKPTDDSFNVFIKETFKDKIDTGNDPFIGMIKNMVANAVPVIVDPKIDDYVVFKIAQVRTGKKAFYIGTLNNWFLIDEQK